MIIGLLCLGCAGGGGLPRARLSFDMPRFVRAERSAVAARPIVPERGSPKRVLRVRLWVGPTVPGGVLAATRFVSAALAQIQPLFAARLGIGLRVVETRSWAREGELSSDQDGLWELRAGDPADDVDWVLGVAGPLARPSASLRRLGAAMVGSPYAMVHLLDGPAEREHLSRQYLGLPKGDRAVRLQAAVAHKAGVMLAHLFFRSLGAPRVRAKAAVMAPRYLPGATHLASATRKVVLAALGAAPLRGRLDFPTVRRAVRTVLLAGDRAWFGRDRARLATLLGLAPKARPAVIPAMARARFDRALSAYEEAEFEEGWRELLPSVRRFPDEPEVMRLACRLRRSIDAEEAEAARLCKRAVALTRKAEDLAPYALGEFLAEAGDRNGALRAFREAARGLRGDSDTRPADWVDLARQFMGIDAVYFAELSLRQAGGVHAPHLQRWIRAARRQFALPKDAALSGIATTEEPDYAAEQTAIIELLQGDRRAVAGPRIAAYRKRWPHAPGPLIVVCEYQLRFGKASVGVAACRRAVAIFPEASNAHLLLGSWALRRGRTAEAVVSLSRALELDDERSFVWRELWTALKRDGRSQKAAALVESYRRRFGRALSR